MLNFRRVKDARRLSKRRIDILSQFVLQEKSVDGGRKLVWSSFKGRKMTLYPTSLDGHLNIMNHDPRDPSPCETIIESTDVEWYIFQKRSPYVRNCNQRTQCTCGSK
ncbi:hypothetical protein OCU04_012484 [Sclerotinia nivalis]|uniref:Uncharacterized protein n=1 Tax=Sclerotinia nivalis TaxID=352851 RepID=A0A9X0DDA6_9HELO|nr:hypothetical protein OCU04_012484 [Sclerotinia nivalis]